MDEEPPTDAATRLLTRLREFSRQLGDDERELFAVLIGPRIAELAAPSGDEVEGFGADTVRWEPTSLRDRLSSAVADSEWHVVDG